MTESCPQMRVLVKNLNRSIAKKMKLFYVLNKNEGFTALWSINNIRDRSFDVIVDVSQSIILKYFYNGYILRC